MLSSALRRSVASARVEAPEAAIPRDKDHLLSLLGLYSANRFTEAEALFSASLPSQDAPDRHLQEEELEDLVRMQSEEETA